MGKKEFEFYQDVKVTVWQRQHFRIEAESIEEAREQAKRYTQFDVSYEDDIDVDEIEWLHDTEELMTPEDNNGESTIEVYELDDKGKGVIIADNANPDKSNVEELRIAKGKFCPKCGGSLRFEHDDVLFTYYCSECGENFNDSDVQ